MTRYFCRHADYVHELVWICQHVFIRVAIDLSLLSHQQLGGATR